MTLGAKKREWESTPRVMTHSKLVAVEFKILTENGDETSTCSQTFVRMLSLALTTPTPTKETKQKQKTCKQKQKQNKNKNKTKQPKQNKNKNKSETNKVK